MSYPIYPPGPPGPTRPPGYAPNYQPGLTDAAGIPNPEVMARLRAQQAAAQQAAEPMRPPVPADRWYTAEHAWVAIDGMSAAVGITGYAVELLGTVHEMLDVSLPAIGTTVTAGELCGEIVSASLALDLVSPVDGQVAEVNEELDNGIPRLVATRPDIWMFRVRMTADADGEVALPSDLLSAADYDAMIRHRRRMAAAGDFESDVGRELESRSTAREAAIRQQRLREEREHIRRAAAEERAREEQEAARTRHARVTGEVERNAAQLLEYLRRKGIPPRDAFWTNWPISVDGPARELVMGWEVTSVLTRREAGRWVGGISYPVRYDGNPEDAKQWQRTGEKVQIRGVGLLPDGVLYVFDTGGREMERPPRNITGRLVTSPELWNTAQVAEGGPVIDSAKPDADVLVSFWHNKIVQFAARVAEFEQ